MNKEILKTKNFTLDRYWAGRGGKRYQITQRYKEPYPDDNTHCRFMGYVTLSEEEIWEIIRVVEEDV